MFGVHKEHRRRGISKRLIEISTDIAKTLGFRAIKAEATGPGSRRALESLDFEAVAEIKYDEFAHNGRKMFPNLTASSSCVLLSKALT